MYFVTGASGNAGGAVARALIARGESVVALVRRANSALPSGAIPVVGDLNVPESFAHALRGVKAIFMLAGYERIDQTLALARQAGVERIVLLSSSAAPGGDLSNAVARYHILSEQALRASGLHWTFLQPNSLMSNTFEWVPQLRAGDTIRAPFPDVPIASIDPDDLGAVAAATMTSGSHDGHTFRLSGPESLRPADRVAVLSATLGRALRYEPMSDAEARAEMGSRMPAQYVDAFMSFYADGTLDESVVLPTVEELTGSRPRRFEQWTRNNAAALR